MHFYISMLSAHYSSVDVWSQVCTQIKEFLNIKESMVCQHFVMVGLDMPPDTPPRLNLSLLT